MGFQAFTPLLAIVIPCDFAANDVLELSGMNYGNFGKFGKNLAYMGNNMGNTGNLGNIGNIGVGGIYDSMPSVALGGRAGWTSPFASALDVNPVLGAATSIDGKGAQLIVPKLDLIDLGEEFLIKADLPGVHHSDVHVNVRRPQKKQKKRVFAIRCDNVIFLLCLFLCLLRLFSFSDRNILISPPDFTLPLPCTGDAQGADDRRREEAEQVGVHA
jgi:hypothetical protein